MEPLGIVLIFPTLSVTPPHQILPTFLNYMPWNPPSPLCLGCQHFSLVHRQRTVQPCSGLTASTFRLLQPILHAVLQVLRKTALETKPKPSTLLSAKLSWHAWGPPSCYTPHALPLVTRCAPATLVYFWFCQHITWRPAWNLIPLIPAMTPDVTSSENPSPTSALLSSAISLFARGEKWGCVPGCVYHTRALSQPQG